MKLKFLIDRLGIPHLQNAQQSIMFDHIRKQQDNLIKQLYEMMVVDNGIYKCLLVSCGFKCTLFFYLSSSFS
jgi:hypothetical protein